MNANQTRVQPYEVVRHLRSNGIIVTYEQVRETAKSLGLGRILRSPQMGLVFKADEVAKLLAAFTAR